MPAHPDLAAAGISHPIRQLPSGLLSHVCEDVAAPFIIDGPSGEQKIDVLVTPTDTPVDVYVLLEKDRVAAGTAMLLANAGDAKASRRISSMARPIEMERTTSKTPGMRCPASTRS